ncbi:pre-mRNA splicing factor [Datura stramonium]|uniref:Pre-mRNA splicing factor n=1 Tax=Datura stramonium TaxID=4076 RepID=A0ABS8UMZ5_DATST|nr:pre-mRNA splicing factor [Datura stramonium]
MGESETVVAQTSSVTDYISAGYSSRCLLSKKAVRTAMAYDASQDLAALADAPVDSSQVADYESSANGNNTAEARDIAATGAAENGIAAEVHGSSTCISQKMA